MDPARYERLQSIFHRIVDLPAGDREPALRHECGEDDALLADVRAMLEEDARTSVLDGGVARAAHTILRTETSIVEEIGPYELLSVLGEGGMGVVHLARRSDLGTLAAIKILRDAWLSPERRERFTFEQRTLAKLNHPAIARLYDAGTLSDGTPWIVMEHVDGAPLREYCRERSLAVHERLRLVRDVAEAVQHAHRHLVVHRDLKPTNILVSRDGRVKLLDFGIAKELEDGGSLADRTRTLIRLMTPAYAAPEQVKGEGIGLHTDVYGLGVVLYELLTGSVPLDFSNKSTVEVERMILDQEPKRPSAAILDESPAADRPRDAQTIGSSAWSDLDMLCLKALHKDPARRYQSAEAFIRDIDHFFKREPLDAQPDAIGYRVRKFVARNWRPLLASAAGVVVLFGVIAFYTVRLTRARNEAVIEATRAQRVQALMRDVFSGGEDGTAPAEYLRVVDVLDRGKLAAESIANEPAVQAELFRTLGSIYGELGRFSDADSLINKALERTRSIYGADSPQMARALDTIALLRLEQGKYEEAGRFARDEVALSRRLSAGNASQVARALTTLGRVLEEQGGYPEAIKTLDEAVVIQSAYTAASVELATSLRHLGNVNFYAGNLDAADSHFKRVLAMTRKVSGERHALVGDDLINLGAVEFERGRHAEAERYYREALPIVEGWYGKDHGRTASNLTMLGRALVAQKHYDEAVPLLQRAVGIQEHVYGAIDIRVASAVNELGIVALQRSRYDEAAAAFQRMADIYRKVYPAKHYLTATALANLGSVYNTTKDFRRAEGLIREAIDTFEATQGPRHVNSGIAHVKLGRALAGQTRYAEAEKEFLAGYDVIRALSPPPASWLKASREDLVKLYTSWQRPDKAERFKLELSAPSEKR